MLYDAWATTLRDSARTRAATLRKAAATAGFMQRLASASSSSAQSIVVSACWQVVTTCGFCLPKGKAEGEIWRPTFPMLPLQEDLYSALRKLFCSPSVQAFKE